VASPEKSWILYDVANSANVLVVVTAVMPFFFKEVAALFIAGGLSLPKVRGNA